ncbi:MAG: hypothetical protein QME21_09630 [Anaerolineales bacterium]|jgi:hypothetical protein|nr:hypothetical protein [Anaerolineales bacterium]
MIQKRPVQPKPRRGETPQLRVRSNLSAGESLEACLRNLDYWQKAYREQCILR